MDLLLGMSFQKHSVVAQLQFSKVRGVPYMLRIVRKAATIDTRLTLL